MKKNLLQIIKSMSSGEKRSFALNCKKQGGKKSYYDLFSLINSKSTVDWTRLIEEFHLLHPNKSFNNSCHYLMKNILDTLVGIKSEHDPQFQSYQELMRADVLFERSLPQEGYRKIKKIQSISEDIQDHSLGYLSSRLELNYLKALGLGEVDEKQLISIHNKAKNSLKMLRQINEHHSLYELLQHRLTIKGGVFSENEKKKLDDLVLSELSLMTLGMRKSFESQSVHLLFQSYYFTNIGNNKLALKIFKDLNNLFENNKKFWGYPPIDYLSTLEGILNNLRSINGHSEIPYYLNKLNLLNNSDYPEHFCRSVKLYYINYRLVFLLKNQNLNESIEYIDIVNNEIIDSIPYVSDSLQCELLLNISLTYFQANDLKKSHTYISQIFLNTKPNYSINTFRIAKFIALIIIYERKQLDYLEYELRAFKRAINNKLKLSKLEKLVLKVLMADPDSNSVPKNQTLWKSILPKIENIEKDKFETKSLKYFDFIFWIKSHFGAK